MSTILAGQLPSMISPSLTLVWCTLWNFLNPFPQSTSAYDYHSTNPSAEVIQDFWFWGTSTNPSALLFSFTKREGKPHIMICNHCTEYNISPKKKQKSKYLLFQAK
uniref:Uncharacterized protein n=1 Tax=Rhizophora mucronata TaxID=61149 RepID=A0A2P2IU03_RHIMU